MRKMLLAGMTAMGIAVLSLFAPALLHAQQVTTVAIDNDDIGGVVRGAKGPEAGVWVIAETRDLPVRFIRIVVTKVVTSSQICRKPNTMCGCGATALSIRPR